MHAVLVACYAKVQCSQKSHLTTIFPSAALFNNSLCVKHCMDNFPMSFRSCDTHNDVIWHRIDNFWHHLDVARDVVATRCLVIPTTTSTTIALSPIEVIWTFYVMLLNLCLQLHVQPNSTVRRMSVRCCDTHNDIIWHSMEIFWRHLDVPRDIADTTCLNSDSQLTAQPNSSVARLYPPDFMVL